MATEVHAVLTNESGQIDIQLFGSKLRAEEAAFEFLLDYFIEEEGLNQDTHTWSDLLDNAPPGISVSVTEHLVR